MLNCLLNLVASCLDDDENEIPLKVIASFSAVCFAFFLVVLFWSMFSIKSLRFVSLCSQSQMHFWMFLFSSDEVGSLLQRLSRLVITSSISAGTGSSWSLCRPLGM